MRFLILITLLPPTSLWADFVDQKVYEARQAIYDGQFDLAVRRAREVLDVHPQDAEGLEVLGVAQYLKGDLKGALLSWKHARKLDPQRRAIPEFIEMAEALLSVGPKPAPDLIRDLGSLRRKRRLNAELRLIESPPEILPELVTAFGQGNRRSRSGIVAVLGSIKAPSEAVSKYSLPTLIMALSDKDTEVRSRAATSLGFLKIGTTEAIHALTKCLDDPEEEVRRAADGGLSLIGTPEAHAIRKLYWDRQNKQ